MADGLRLAVVGKGGSGKSVIAATLARLLARRGRRVLALDSDPLPGLAFSIGTEPLPEPLLNAAAERGENKRWRFIRGVGPVRAAQRYSTEAPDGVRLLQIGKATSEGMAPVMAASNAFYMTIHGLENAATFRDWVILGDLPAGPRQTAFDWAPYARRFLVVAEPTWQGMLTARRIMRIAKGSRSDVELSLIVNKCAGPQEAERVAGFLDLPALAAVPLDEQVRSAEREGEALLDHAPESAAVHAIEGLADRLDTGRVR